MPLTMPRRRSTAGHRASGRACVGLSHHRHTVTPMQMVQGTFDDLGTALADVTFVVVDLETTGGSPADSAITEIGAVKVRGGVVLGEFQTLVNPHVPIPPFIQALTGITTDRKSTRLNSSHMSISYAVFCLKKKKN